jgi:DNA polymerase-1
MPAPVVFIDANNLLHRYFHAMPTQIGREGKNVNAVRGLGELVGRLWRLFHPQAIVAAFDAGDSGRTALLPTYKADREGTPPELLYQMDLARRFFPSHYHVDVVHAQGYEADDVIVTLVRLFRGQGVETIVVTNDKDLTCIVTDEQPCATLYSTAGSEWKRIDAAAVRDRLGVPPSAVIDYLALCGDASDSVPGVPGIGPKTAAALLAQAGSLDALYRNLEAVERPRWRELLEQHRDAAYAARKVLAPVEVPPAIIQAGTTVARRRS